MTNEITNCPKCKTLILSDTLQCPSCNHILNQDAKEIIKANELALQASSKAVDEKNCKECGVSVRSGVVRCWNCGAFMNEGLEKTFRAKQALPQTLILSDQPDAPKSSSISKQTLASSESQVQDDDFDDDAGFELSSNLELHDFDTTNDEDDFQLSDETQWSTASESSGEIPVSLDESGDDDLNANQDSSDDPDSIDEEEPGDEEVEPEMRDFLKMVIREDAAEFARQSRRNKTQSKKTAKILKQIPGGLIIVPPCKCIKVKIRFQDMGKTLVCPKCKHDYHSPDPVIRRTRTLESKNMQQGVQLKSFNSKTVAIKTTDLKYSRWIEFASLHEYIPEKTKNKPGILQKMFVPVDIGFSDDGILIIEYAKKPGAYTADDKRIIKLRETIREMIKAGTKFEDTKEYSIYEVPVGWLSYLEVVYPVNDQVEKDKIPFGGVPIFGEGKVAVKFPANQAGHYTIALSLSQYRGLAHCCLEKYGFIRFTSGSPLGLVMTTRQVTCRLSKVNFEIVNDAEFYLHDPLIKLEKVGSVCESCHEFVSTKGEADEKVRITKLIAESKKKKSPSPVGIAGLANQTPKLPAKGKCILCSKNFGNNSSYILASVKKETPAEVKADKPVPAPTK